MEKKLLMGIFAGACVALLLSGCGTSSGSRRTETITTRTIQEDAAAPGNEGYATSADIVHKAGSSDTTIVEKRQVEEHAQAPHRGVVGSVLHVVGEVIAFPFRLIAGIFDLVF